MLICDALKYTDNVHDLEKELDLKSAAAMTPLTTSKREHVKKKRLYEDDIHDQSDSNGVDGDSLQKSNGNVLVRSEISVL